MQDDHLALEDMADWLSGRLEHESVLAKVFPHFLAGCPACRERYGEILRLQEELGHWDESIAVREGLAAPERLAELARLPFDEQMRRIEEDTAFQTWGLCQLLLKKSAEALLDDPARAAGLAELAVAATRHLPAEAYHPDWVADLTAKAWAYLGHARWVRGEARGARAAFQRATEALAQSSSGNLLVESEVLGLLRE